MLRVWVLTTLVANFDERQPLYRHEGPFYTITGVRFVDNVTVETTSDAGLQRWNILTGEAVPFSN